jgi:AraC-like DNA-binding protein
MGRIGLLCERTWRCIVAADRSGARDTEIVVSRWINSGSHRQEGSASSADRHIIGVSLKSTRLRLTRGPHTILDGVMPAGTIYVTGPSVSLVADFRTPCDFIHFHVASDYLRSRQRAAHPDSSVPLPDLNGLMIRDPLADLLSRKLMTASDADDLLYATCIGQAIVMHIARMRSTQRTAGTMQGWRLKCVQEYIDAHLGDALRLSDLASVAGLSPMHYAAQFRAATGCRPHDYVLGRRIEHAKAMLSNTDMPLAVVALTVGFRGQAHFSTVFKRFTGQTPAHWRRATVHAGGPLP